MPRRHFLSSSVQMVWVVFSRERNHIRTIPNGLIIEGQSYLSVYLGIIGGVKSRVQRLQVF